MEKSNFILIFSTLIYFSLNLIPLWNLKKSSFDLTSPITIFEKQDGEQLHAILNKTITKDNNIIIDIQNKITMKESDKTILDTDWEDIDYVAFIENYGHYICPKGTNFFHIYNNYNFIKVQPFDNYDTNDEWELTCSFKEQQNVFFVGFLNSKTITKLYAVGIGNFYWWQGQNINDGLFDFLWGNEFSDNSLEYYQMYVLTLNNFKINLQKIILKHNPSDAYFEITNYLEDLFLDYNSTYTHSYFNNKTKLFYWMSLNSTNQFRSGYSLDPIKIEDFNNNLNINITRNLDSPFYFLKEVEIKKIDFIRNTKYAYYEIYYNKEKNEIYSGIIDIELNKIIFNTNETLKQFLPFKGNSMLAITNENVYRVCAIKNNEETECIDKCPDDKELILDTEKGNYCIEKGTSKKCDNYILKPYDICIDNCNIEFYVYNSNNECGACKVIYDNKLIYKINNQNTCLETKPENTFYINEQMKIIDYCKQNCKSCTSYEDCESCYEGYELSSSGECEKIEECYENCELCHSKSEDINNQHCYKCKNNYKLYEKEGNCFENCRDGYYENDIYCSECHQNCKTCSKGEDNSGNETNENCESCDSNKYLIKAESFPSNCVDECPNGTVAEDYTCVNESTDDNNKSNSNTNNSNSNYNNKMLFIYVIITGLFLLIIFICIYRKICIMKRSSQDLINNLTTELAYR